MRSADLHLVGALAEGDHVDAAAGQHANELEADGPAADQHGGVAGLNAGFLDAAQNAGQRLDHGGVEKGDVIGNLQQVLADDAPRDAHVLGVGAVVEEQVLAEIAAILAAKQADAAGSGVGRHDARAHAQRCSATSEPSRSTTPASSWPKTAGGVIMRA